MDETEIEQTGEVRKTRTRGWKPGEDGRKGEAKGLWVEKKVGKNFIKHFSPNRGYLLSGEFE